MPDTILAGVVVLILAGIGRLIWCWTPRLNRRISRWREHRRYAKEQWLNEAVVLTNDETNDENRHRGCVRRGQEIDEREPGISIPLGLCTVCGVHASFPRDASKSYR